MRTRLCDVCVRVGKREVLVSQMGSRIIKLKTKIENMHSKINRKRCYEPMVSFSHPKNTLISIQNFQINNFTFLKLFDTL